MLRCPLFGNIQRERKVRNIDAFIIGIREKNVP